MNIEIFYPSIRGVKGTVEQLNIIIENPPYKEIAHYKNNIFKNKELALNLRLYAKHLYKYIICIFYTGSIWCFLHYTPFFRKMNYTDQR